MAKHHARAVPALALSVALLAALATAVAAAETTTTEVVTVAPVAEALRASRQLGPAGAAANARRQDTALLGVDEEEDPGAEDEMEEEEIEEEDEGEPEESGAPARAAAAGAGVPAGAEAAAARAPSHCGFPGAPAHSSVSLSDESLVEGTVASYSCERGFELLGPARRVCGPHGRWIPDGIPFCVLNVAAGKAPMQSSTEVVPQRAVDGSTSAAFSASTCSLTRPERAPWWYVNLLEPYMVQLVRLDFGKSCCGQQGAATVVVRVGNSRPDLGSNPICNRFTGPLTEGRPLFLPCNPPMPGAFVSVHLETAGGTAQLSLCEAFVYTDQALPMERCPQFRDAPPGSMATYNGKCYAFHSRTALPFREALAYCRARGGSLVDESNPALQGFISWELWRRHRSDSGSQYWLGAVRDPADRNNWKWLGGGDVTVSFWNLPGGDQDCARYDGAKGWLWSDTACDARLAFICQHQPTACGRPEQPPNSTLAAPQGFAVGAEVRVACDPGHLLVGPSVRTCLPTGFYDEFPPVCKRVECGLPASIAHGFYHLLDGGSVGLGARVRYSCDEGFALRGRALLTCDADERWDGPPPACLPVRCEPPPAIANGRFSTGIANHTAGVRAGTVVQYSCARRFVLHGPRSLTCLPSGQYDQDPPTCSEETTSGLPVPVPPATSPSAVPPAVGTRPTGGSTRPGGSRPQSTRPSQTPAKATTPPPPPPPPPTPATRPSSQRPHIIGATHSGPPAHPLDNEVPDSAHVRNTGSPGANLVPPLEEDRREPGTARLNLGAIIALGVFGGFVVLAAIITTIVILIRRSRSAKHYRHRASPDCNTVASFDSSGSEGRAGLNRYYRQAWENLHHQAGSGGKNPLRRQETLDEPVRGAGELLVTAGMTKPAPPQQEKKRHHHHHHHHGPSSSGTKETSNTASDWRNRPSKNRY